MTKRILSVCLALVLLFGVLAGCSKNEAQTADDTKKTEQSDTEDKTSTQFAYQAQYFDLPEEIQWIGTSCVTGDTLYFTASVPDGGKETYTDENGEEYSYDTYSEVIFRFDLDTGECVQLDNYVAEPVVENPDMPVPSTYHRGALLYRLRLYPLNLPDNAVKGKAGSSPVLSTI